MGTELYSVARIAEALRASAGIFSAAAQKIGCAPNTIRNYVDRHVELQEVVEEVREGTLDLAESQLLKAMGDGNLTACIFFLKCKGKHRGYVERQEMTGPGGTPLVLRVADITDLSDDALRTIVNGHSSAPPQSRSSP